MTAWTLAVVLLAAEDVYTATLVFEKMHCEECRRELEATVQRMQGCRGVTFSGESAVVTFDERAPVPAFNRLPKDLAVRAVKVSLRGTVSFAGDKATLAAKGSGQALALVNPESPKGEDRLGELRRRLEGKNRFRISGTLVGGKMIVLESFEPTDWKD
jgi:copper chaperone CopZ